MVHSETSVSDFLQKLNLKEAIILSGQAWNQVSARCIQGCWRKGLGLAFDSKSDLSDSDVSFDGFEARDLEEAEKRISDLRDSDHAMLDRMRTALGKDVDHEMLQRWISVDDEEPAHKSLTDDEIISSIREGPEDSAENILEEDEDEDEEVEPLPSMTVIQGLEAGLRWLESDKCGTSAKVMHLRNIIHDAKAAARKKAVQRKVTDFFTSGS